MSTPTCPFCAATDAEQVGMWGGQIITAQWRCGACSSFFEAVRDDFEERGAGEERDDAVPASIRLRRRIEWIDTDAAGIYHWTTIFRLAEAAEAELFTALGIAEEMFGATPRVSVSMEFKHSLKFNDSVEVDFAIAAVGRSSIRYAIAVRGEDEVAAEGTIVVCLVDRETGRPLAVPDRQRRLLTGSGLIAI